MKITIKVLKTDIKKGRPRSNLYCPIAIALRRQGYKGVFVTDDSIEDKYQTIANLPFRARYFIGKFDVKGRKSVKPFSFKLGLAPKAY